MVESPVFALFSPAKINIGLSIVGRRKDGHHNLESLFWPIDFGDTILLKPSSEFSVECFWAVDVPSSNQRLPTTHENIVGRLFNEQSLNPFQVSIQKRIPMGGGLGGGSSNVGTILKFLNLPNATRIAETLGADVPFFLTCRPSWVTGTGEVVEPLTFPSEKIPTLYFLVILSEIHSSTADVFKAYLDSQLPFSKARVNPFSPTTSDVELYEFFRTAHNDLEPLVCQRSPAISETISALRQTPCLYAGLTGSGSSCYAIYANSEDCENSRKVLLALCRKLGCRNIIAKTFQGEQPWKSQK